MYNGCVKSVLCYGAECWVLKKRKKLQTIYCIENITYETFKDGISNDRIREIKVWR